MPGFDFSNHTRNAALHARGVPLPKATSTGTTIVGCIFEGGVVIAADTRATSGPIVADKNCEKLHYIAPQIWCAGAGTAADTEFTTALISSQLELHSLSTGRKPRVVTCMTMLKQHLFRYQGHIGAYLVVAGVDPTGVGLFTVHAHGSTDKLPYVTMGSGSLAAMSIFETQWKASMTEQEAVTLCSNAIQAGIFNDLGSGSNVDVCVITKEKTTLKRGYVKPNERSKKQKSYVFKRGTTAILNEKIITREEISNQSSKKDFPNNLNEQRPETKGLQATPSGSSTGSTQPRIRRRNRMITSCLESRRRKLKCNKSHPCTNCVKFTRDCVFLAPALDPASQLKLTEIKEKVGSLERLLERDVAKPIKTAEKRLDRALPDDADDDLPGHEDERELEPTPLAIEDAAYGEEGEDDDLLDLGIQMKKMRTTERIGGFLDQRFRKRSVLVFGCTVLYLVLDPDASKLSHNMTDTFNTGYRDTTEKEPSPASFVKPVPSASEWLKPGPSYIMPSSGFFFGSQGQAPRQSTALLSRKNTIHFGEEVSLGIEPPNSVQAVVFAAMFSGAVSMDESSIMRDVGVTRESLVNNFKLGTETALSRANFLRTTKVETLQGFVMYLIPLCRSEVSRAHSVLLGAALRMAECMGLHRDGESYGMNPIETHGEFDTKLPLNINDVDLHASGDSPVFADRWTDATFSLIRFEIMEMMRQLWVDRPKIERRQMSLTALLSKIEHFKANMAAKYDHLIDDRIPVQKAAKLVKALLTSRLHVMVLHRYHNSVVSPMPDRLRAIMITNGIVNLETAMALETLPELKNWAWYTGALTQYHTAFLLLLKIYVYPKRKEADRIWHCLDYIFECDPTESRRNKALRVLSELQQKTAIYQSMRGMRAPTNMDRHVGQRPLRVANGMLATESKPLIYLKDSEARAAALAEGAAQIQAVEQQNIAFPAASPPVPASIGTSAVSEVVFAGATPDTSSEGTSSVPGVTPSTSTMGTDDLMADIDWDVFDTLFPPDQPDFEMPRFNQYQFPSSSGSGGEAQFLGGAGGGTY
ncbi:hypothetical protein HYALB_00000152 [Hymenoscyphus albidus]|uniref:proteasome endopeptidase complex n=1 Tax=Hymenoscyphus albidus TaxID=595503 RepID=A0A9N9LJB8_9HELO|nr:hypothetical protein HYALB_00000152 [Hymenoscyphus albidus]